MTMRDVLESMRGCTVVFSDEKHFITWNGQSTFQVFAVLVKRGDVSLVEYDVWMSGDPPATVEKACQVARERVEGPDFLTYARFLEYQR